MGKYILGTGTGDGGDATSGSGAAGMLIGMIARKIGGNYGTPSEDFNVRLHTGSPGEEGSANIAAENTVKAVKLSIPNSVSVYTVGRANLTAAVEWKEVKANETYKWISLLDPKDGKFIMAIELTAPVPVVIGDTFIINKEKLIVKLKKEGE